jgi:hypothetical protein
MDHPVTVTGHPFYSLSLFFVHDFFQDQSLGDFFVFADRPAETLGQDVTAEIKKTLQCPP